MTDFLATLWGDAKKYWREPWMAWVAPIASATIIAVGGIDQDSLRLSPARGMLAVVVLLGARMLWHLTTRIPTIPKGVVGIVVGIRAQDAEQDQQLRTDFVQHLRQQVAGDQPRTGFFLLELPSWASDLCIDPQAAFNVLRSTRGHMLVYGAAVIRRTQGKEVHLLELSGVVRHAPVPVDRTADLAVDFRTVLPTMVVVPKDDDLLAFNATSERTEIAARYVIAIAAMMSGDLPYAETLLLSVEERLKRTGKGLDPSDHLGRQLPLRFRQLYSQWLDALFNAYYHSRQRAYLTDADRISRDLLRRDPHSFQAHLFAAIAHFVLRRDVAAAKRAIRACRPMKDAVWRYSHAFLYAYEGNLSRARSEYEAAFRGPLADVTVPVQIEEFMHIVLEEEPDKIQLHYASGLINMYAKDDREGARRDFAAFLARGGEALFPEEAQHAQLLLRELS
jgi:hypothetical protein